MREGAATAGPAPRERRGETSRSRGRDRPRDDAAAHEVSVYTAYALWLVGGWWGLHHFYLGREHQVRSAPLVPQAPAHAMQA